MPQLYQKQFTGEIPPVIITQATPDNSEFVKPGSLEPITVKELPILQWRNIAKTHLPANAKIETAEYQFSLEYFHIDYWIPSVTVVPSNNLPIRKPREPLYSEQARTVEFKNKYNRDSGHAIEIRLLRSFDKNYLLNDNPTDTFNSSGGNYDVNLQYPISELLYNNRLTGGLSLLPYLTRDGGVVFGNVQQEIKLQVIPNLGSADILTITGGYTGSVTYELNPVEPIITVSQVFNISSSPVEVLPINNNRMGFYLSNNGLNEVYFNFGAMANLSLKLTLKPGSTLVYEDKSLFIDGVQQNLSLDNRHRMNLPVWLRSINPSQVSVEELSYS